MQSSGHLALLLPQTHLVTREALDNREIPFREQTREHADRTSIVTDQNPWVLRFYPSHDYLGRFFRRSPGDLVKEFHTLLFPVGGRIRADTRISDDVCLHTAGMDA